MCKATIYYYNNSLYGTRDERRGNVHTCFKADEQKKKSPPIYVMHGAPSCLAISERRIYNAQANGAIGEREKKNGKAGVERRR